MPAVLQGDPSTGVREARLTAADATAGFGAGTVGFAHGRSYRFADPSGATYTIPGEEAAEALSDGLRLIDDEYSPAPAPREETEPEKDAAARARLAAAGLADMDAVPSATAPPDESWLGWVGRALGSRWDELAKRQATRDRPISLPPGATPEDQLRAIFARDAENLEQTPEERGQSAAVVHGLARSVPYIGPRVEGLLARPDGMSDAEWAQRAHDLERTFPAAGLVGEGTGIHYGPLGSALGGIGSAVRSATGATAAGEAIAKGVAAGVKPGAAAVAKRAAGEVAALAAEGEAFTFAEAANEAALAKDGDRGEAFGEHVASHWWTGPAAMVGLGGAGHAIGIAAERRAAARELATRSGATPSPGVVDKVRGWFRREVSTPLKDLEAPSPYRAEFETLETDKPEAFKKLVADINDPAAVEAERAREMGLVVDTQRAATDIAAAKDVAGRRAEEFVETLEPAEKAVSELARVGTNKERSAWRAGVMPGEKAGTNAVDAIDRLNVFGDVGRELTEHADQAVRGEVARELDAIAKARGALHDAIPAEVRAGVEEDVGAFWRMKARGEGRPAAHEYEMATPARKAPPVDPNDPDVVNVARERLAARLDALHPDEQKAVNVAVADAMTELRQRLDQFSKWGLDKSEPAGIARHMRAQPGLRSIRDMANDAREFLASPERWGQEIATAQRAYNEAFSRFQTAKDVLRGAISEKALADGGGGAVEMALSERKIAGVLKRAASEADPLIIEKIGDYTKALQDLAKASTLMGADAGKAKAVAERMASLGRTMDAVRADTKVYAELRDALRAYKVDEGKMRNIVSRAGLDPAATAPLLKLADEMEAVGKRLVGDTMHGAHDLTKADMQNRMAGFDLMGRAQALRSSAERTVQRFEYVNKLDALDEAARTRGLITPKLLQGAGYMGGAVGGTVGNILGAPFGPWVQGPLAVAGVSGGAIAARTGAALIEAMTNPAKHLRAKATRQFAVEQAQKRGEEASKNLVLRNLGRFGAAPKKPSPLSTSLAERGKRILDKLPTSVRYTGSLVAQRALRERFVGAVDMVRDARANQATAMADIVEQYGHDLATSPKEAESAARTLGRAIDFLEARVPVGFRRTASPFPQKEPTDAGVSPIQADRFLRYVEAVADPVGVVEAAARGEVTREGVEALREVYPDLFEDVKARVMAEAEASPDPLPFQTQTQLTIMFGTPMRPSLDPEIVARIQGALTSDDQPDAEDGGGMGPGRGETRQTRAGAMLGQMSATPTQRLAAGGMAV